MLGRLAVRCTEVPVVFAGSRKFAEEWAYRFSGADVQVGEAVHQVHLKVATLAVRG